MKECIKTKDIMKKCCNDQGFSSKILLMENCECDDSESHVTQLYGAGQGVRDGAKRVAEKNFLTALCLQTRCWERSCDLNASLRLRRRIVFAFRGTCLALERRTECL